MKTIEVYAKGTLIELANDAVAKWDVEFKEGLLTVTIWKTSGDKKERTVYYLAEGYVRETEVKSNELS
ncbi:MAG: hypothetical protein ACP5LX_06630 [Nitrososphaeria archaeon]|nr:hypothetical protein [TACK group archaeon]